MFFWFFFFKVVDLLLRQHSLWSGRFLTWLSADSTFGGAWLYSGSANSSSQG